ncbi:hypothetical protein C5167_005362 [Papaver somniferum]|uniref:Uncharacterized protein n=1 Tax=Papaver somniferum TaxID=3469 RepID=A0A4Y7JE80_PAPSO|nr:uncharacterized protein LOC113275376 [Papaver somniferum]RZC58059.1 hypothetical protein C5167_005362 [Papaver somniferum]
MAIVTGDRYLDFLVKYVDKQAGLLLEGSIILKLNPVGLHYVQSRIEALEELEGLLSGAPVDYLRAYVSDLGDHRALEQLRRILRLLTSLKVVSVLPPQFRDPTPLSLLPFGRLRVLELRGCDLSTSAARGLLELRHTLEKIICHNSTDALRHVFASRIVDIRDSQVWKKLTFVSCACNNLILMDESLQLLPVVETLDLSRNRFAKVDNLRKCVQLKHLDLGFNHLRTIASFAEVSSSIVKLVLRHNALTTLRGIENLKSLQGIDLSYNIISSFSELEIVASLPSLQSLWLEGNPICCSRWYRAQVFSLFSNIEKFELDDKEINTQEAWQRQIIIASRQMRPAAYGFYSPAKHHSQGEEIIRKGESSAYGKRKKMSRLASIADEEQRRLNALEGVEQDSLSCDSEILSRDENIVSDGEAEIIGLMNKVEFMKKERSVLWLREFKEWMMDQAPEGMVEKNGVAGLSSPGKENYIPNKSYHKHVGKSSRYVSESQTSVVERTTNILESLNALADTSSGVNAYQYPHSVSKRPPESSVLGIGRDAPPMLRVEESDLKQGLLQSYSQENLNLSEPSLTLGNDGVGGKPSGKPLAGIDALLESHSFTSTQPGSPPHYQENLLHRRQNLEEEFLQLSTESLSLASSDTETSCSNDHLCISDKSLGEDEFLPDEELPNGTIDDHPKAFSHDHYWKGRHGAVRLNRLEPEHGQQVHTAEKLGNTSFVDTESDTYDEAERFVDKKGRRRTKKRVISLSEGESAENNTGALSNSENGISDLRDLNLRGRAGLMSKSTTQNPLDDEFIKDYFHASVADAEVSETCLQHMPCDTVFEEDSRYKESEVTLVRSSENRLYVLLFDSASDGSGIIARIIGRHRLDDLQEVVVSIGLQALRVHFRVDVAYLFITRDIEKSKRLLSLIQVSDSTLPSNACSFTSLEQVQIESFDEHVCGGLKVSIFLYSMLLFWHKNTEEEELWLPRSVFVIEGYLLICSEDIIQLSCDTNTDDDDAESDISSFSSRYFSLDSSCSISNILEMVIEPRDSKCVTLTLDNNLVSNKVFSSSATSLKKKKDVKKNPNDAGSQKIWKLKWFSEETLSKFVVLLKALYSGTTLTPLPVRCLT